MRRISWAAMVALGGALLAPSVAAANGDYAVGGGTNGFFQLGLSAHSGPSGEDPGGFVSARSRPNGDFPVTGEFPVPFRFGGHVTCLTVDGSRASIKYRFDHDADPTMKDGGIQIFVEDNGPPQNGHNVDRTAFELPMNQAEFELTDPSLCGNPNVAAYTPSETGNIIVHNEQP
jgi:hypothetical protein